MKHTMTQICVKAENLCRATTVAWRAVKIPCDRRIALYQKTRSSCVVKQRRLETTTCTLGKKMKDTCDKYDTCHDRQAALYRKAKPTLMIQEKDRKGYQKFKSMTLPQTSSTHKGRISHSLLCLVPASFFASIPPGYSRRVPRSEAHRVPLGGRLRRSHCEHGGDRQVQEAHPQHEVA